MADNIRINKNTSDFLLMFIDNKALLAFRKYMNTRTLEIPPGLDRKSSIGLDLLINMFENEGIISRVKGDIRNLECYFSQAQKDKFRTEINKRTSVLDKQVATARRVAPKRKGRSTRVLKKPAARFDKETERFLIDKIGRDGVKALSDYIDGKTKAIGYMEGAPPSKLAILQRFFDRNYFKRSAGKYFLSEKGKADYDKVIKSIGPLFDSKPDTAPLSDKARAARPALPERPLRGNWQEILAGIGKEKDWNSLSPEQKVALAKALEPQTRKVFSYRNSKDKVSPQVYLAMAVGDTSKVSDIFSRQVFRVFQDFRPEGATIADPETSSDVVKKATDYTWALLGRNSPDKLMKRYEKTVTKVPNEMTVLMRGFKRRIKQTKAKSTEELFEQLAKSPKEEHSRSFDTSPTTSLKFLVKTEKDNVEVYTLAYIQRLYSKYGINLNLKDLKFSDPYVQESLKNENIFNQVEGVYLRAVVKHFYDYLWSIQHKKPEPKDFYRAALYAQSKAIKYLHDSLPRLRKKMVQADNVLKQEVFEKRTAEFLEGLVSAEGIKALTVYVNTDNEAWDVPKTIAGYNVWNIPKTITGDNLLRLKIIKKMIDEEKYSITKGIFIQFTKVHRRYIEDEFDRIKERQLHPERKLAKRPSKEPALPLKYIGLPLETFVQSIPVKGKDAEERWQNVSDKNKQIMAAYLKWEIDRRLTFDNAVKQKEIDQNTLLKLAIGDPSAAEWIGNVFLINFLDASKTLVTKQDWKDDPENTKNRILSNAEKETWASEKITEVSLINLAAANIKKLKKAGKLEGDLPPGFAYLNTRLRDLARKGIDLKKWWAQKLKTPEGKRLRQRIIDAFSTIYGMKLDFKGLTSNQFANPAERKKWETYLQNAFVASFLENAYTARKVRKALNSSEFHQVAFPAYRAACRELNRQIQITKMLALIAPKKAKPPAEVPREKKKAVA